MHLAGPITVDMPLAAEVLKLYLKSDDGKSQSYCASMSQVAESGFLII
jgi:hypothetical protein